MKTIRIRRSVGNWEVGHERDEPDDACAQRLVDEGIAEFISTPAKVMDKKFHTLSEVIDQAAETEVKAQRERLASSVSGGTAVKTKG